MLLKIVFVYVCDGATFVESLPPGCTARLSILTGVGFEPTPTGVDCGLNAAPWTTRPSSRGLRKKDIVSEVDRLLVLTAFGTPVDIYPRFEANLFLDPLDLS
ncbi:hypothetical protein M514_24710 [Trichuris suis]|uniref:Uncharacterized protein n=1 Tax=Trichuris suis TaxID=68888 RepID=A0A085N0X7_9BILA|nr:hypothetical protein M514_24710 [Trichuris suis]